MQYSTSENGDEVTIMAPDKLNLILERLERIEKTLEKANAFGVEVNSLMSIGMDTIDERVQKLRNRGIDPEQRIQAMVEIMDVMTRPQLVETIKLLGSLAERAPGLVAMAADVFDEKTRDPQVRNQISATANVGSKVLAALNESEQSKTEEVKGILNLVRMLRDPDRRKAMGYIMTFLKNFGKKI